MQGVNYYKHINNDDELTAFVTRHAPLINKIAHYVKNKSPAHIDLDDLIQSGLIGLLEAKSGFNVEFGASFMTYATIKIRFAMFDYLRKNSGLSRHINQYIKQIAQAVTVIENNEQQRLSARTIAQEMGVSLKKYADIINEINSYQSFSNQDNAYLDDIACDKTDNPLSFLELEDVKNHLKRIITTLPKREQIILALYYNEQLNFKEIGNIMDLSEARISQIHTQLMIKLKQRMLTKGGVL